MKQLKVAIVGGGNMGGAIARGLAAQATLCRAEDITVIDPNQAVLEDLKAFNSQMNAVREDDEAIRAADLVIVALKPWLMESVLEGMKVLLDYDRQVVVSIAAGLSFEQLNTYLKKTGDGLPALFRVIPNTAISVGESMTFIAACNASAEQEELLLTIFGGLGKALLVDEKHIAAGTALASCGIAYAFRYIRAAMEAGVEIGFYPEQAKEIIIQTLQGAIDILKTTGSHPEQEIDKVTTPGGITIKGLNAMERHGFTNAVIEGIKASHV